MWTLNLTISSGPQDPWCLSVFLSDSSTFCHLSGTMCLCCGMKGSVVWKRCVWNPCCLEQVRGRRVRKRTSFYSWHGSVRNAALGRRHPPSPILQLYLPVLLSLVSPHLSPEKHGYQPRQLALWARPGALYGLSCLEQWKWRCSLW